MNKIKKIGLILATTAVAFSMSGCASKNILMPGQDKSDCELNSGTHGVCGSPRSIYNAKDKIDGLGKGTDQAYFVHPDGTIQEINNGELGDIVKVKTLSDGRKVTVKVDESGKTILKPIPEGSLQYSTPERNSFLFGQGNDTMMVRNQEVIREAWINTYEDPNGNLAIAHNIMVVTKKPTWAIGEKTPRNVKKMNAIPSMIAKDVIMGEYTKGDPKDDIKLEEYKDNVAETPQADQTLKKYLKGI